MGIVLSEFFVVVVAVFVSLPDASAAAFSVGASAGGGVAVVCEGTSSGFV